MQNIIFILSISGLTIMLKLKLMLPGLELRDNIGVTVENDRKELLVSETSQPNSDDCKPDDCRNPKFRNS